MLPALQSMVSSFKVSSELRVMLVNAIHGWNRSGRNSPIACHCIIPLLCALSAVGLDNWLFHDIVPFIEDMDGTTIVTTWALD